MRRTLAAFGVLLRVITGGGSVGSVRDLPRKLEDAGVAVPRDVSRMIEVLGDAEDMIADYNLSALTFNRRCTDSRTATPASVAAGPRTWPRVRGGRQVLDRAARGRLPRHPRHLGAGRVHRVRGERRLLPDPADQRVLRRHLPRARRAQRGVLVERPDGALRAAGAADGVRAPHPHHVQRRHADGADRPPDDRRRVGVRRRVRVLPRERQRARAGQRQRRPGREDAAVRGAGAVRRRVGLPPRRRQPRDGSRPAAAVADLADRAQLPGPAARPRPAPPPRPAG